MALKILRGFGICAELKNLPGPRGCSLLSWALESDRPVCESLISLSLQMRFFICKMGTIMLIFPTY